MNFEQFGCEKNDIESVHRLVQRNILIQEYCGENFDFINLVDFYYRSTSENAILMFLFICFIYPILFMCVATIADKYLAIGMQDLSNRFKLSPTIAAVTLIAFANGAPDVLSSLSASGKEGGIFISLGSLFGGYIFSATLVVSNVAFCSKDPIKLPKFAVLKEFAFYFASVCVVCIFGLIQTAGYAFVGCYMIVYACYIAASLYAEKLDDAEAAKDSVLDGDLEGHLEGGDDNQPGQSNVLQVNESRAFETVIDIEESDPNLDNKKDDFFSKIVEEITDPESSSMENIILMPLLVMGLLTVCYLDNPFMSKPSKFLIIASSITFTLYTLDLTPFDLMILCLIGVCFAFVFLGLELLKVSKNALEITFELISVFAAIGWISIFSGIIIDFISFLAFYFSINEIILSSILLSAGNTIGDFFGNGALAKAGEPVMGAIASYSGQIFNNFIGFSVNVLSAAGIGDTKFDIFALSYYKGEGAEDKPAPLGNYFLMSVIFTVVVVIIINVLYYSMNNYVLNKKYPTVLICIYVFFFCASMIFGILSRK